MKNWISAWWVVLLGVSLAGCSTMSAPNPDSSKEYIGLFSGAIVGGLAGSALGQKGGGRLTDIGIGAVVGAILGFGLGRLIDDQDRAKAQAVAERNNRARQQINRGVQQSSNWRQSSSPLLTQASRVEPALPLATVVAEKKSPLPGPVQTAKKQDARKASSVNDKFLSVWRSLPSTQWFVNDMKQEELG